MELFSAALIESAEAAANVLLQTRPLLKARLQKISGKSLRVRLLPRDISLVVHFHAEGVSLSQDPNIATDASIAGDLSVLLRLMTDSRSVLFGQGAQIEGDVALIQRIQRSLRDADVDWESWLADQIGDLATASLIQRIAPVRAFLQQTSESLTRNTKLFLQEELASLPARTEFELWAQSVDQLRDQTDSIERRIQRLNDLKKV